PCDMHETSTGERSTCVTTEPPPEAFEPQGGAAEHRREIFEEQGLDRLIRFGREHPTLTVVGLAGAGLLGGLEMAAGVLIGAGVAAAIRRRSGRAVAEPAREARGRLRRAIDRTRHDLGERARAVVLAARGKITPEGERVTRGSRCETGATR